MSGESDEFSSSLGILLGDDEEDDDDFERDLLPDFLDDEDEDEGFEDEEELLPRDEELFDEELFEWSLILLLR